MNSEMTDTEKLYMQSPLVLWVETFKANDGHPLEYRDLYDGVFLCDVMQQIDPRPAYDNVNRSVEDVAVRLLNWDTLVKNIRGFYRDVLQQLLVMRLPNITAICRDPGKDSSFAEIRKAVLLILGCAVQCEQKEAFIDKIMAMDIAAQTEIVENIKEVTDDMESILPVQRPDSPTSCASYTDKMFSHLHRLIKERDECAELASDACQERDYYMSQVEGKPVMSSPQVSPDKHHLALELAECKAKLRHVRQELEDRQEQLSDCRDELHEAMSNCSQLKNENASLLQEARATRSLRDELDIMKEKAAKVDMFEKEILKYKERLNELEFYKARTEELKEDNSILEETRAMLEDQLAGSRKRIETVVELEAELTRYRQQMEEVNRDREADRDKIEYLTGENARLEFEKKSSMNESASLETELAAARSRIGNMGTSLSEQLSETSHSRVLRLELENQRLTARLAEMKETALIQSAEMSLELEKENQRLAKRVEKLQESACGSSEQVIQMESDLASCKEERDHLMKVLDAVKDNSERQIGELERENEQLSQALDNIRERSEKTSDLKVKDLERENKRLHETVSVKNSELSKLEFDMRQMQRSVGHLHDSVDRVKELEQENQALERQNAELHQKVSLLEHCAEKLEQVEHENSDLVVENRKLEKTNASLQSSSSRREQLEQEHISLTVEHQRLQRTLESLKSESDRVLELEEDKEELKKELTQVQKLVDGQKTQKLKQEQMEFEIIDVSNENQRLQKNIEVTTRRLQQLEKDNGDIEAETERLTTEVEALKVTNKRLEERDKEANQLEGEVSRLSRDKAALEKENRKLKQSAELKDSSLEELNAKFSSLSQESKSLRQSLERMKETCGRVKELEKENKELLQELNTDRRTLATLREDLVKEKIQSQELSNELEQLTGELARVGIHTEKANVAEQTSDANRYKALETLMKESLEKSQELKEEKIQALECRLEESKNRNSRLQEELRAAKRESEVLKQRMEEDEVARGTALNVAGRKKDRETERLVRSNASNPTKEILELKDHLVELERSNATLMAETENLHSNTASLTDHCNKMESQLASLQSQNLSMQAHNSTLQERNAKLQVEYTTLQSQTSSALAQQDMLKDQMARLEMERDNLTLKYESLQSSHQSLVSDHESLQHLHHQLTSEYESLVSEHGSLKSMHKSLKSELRDLQEQLDALLQGKDDVNKLREVLERDRDMLQKEVQSQGNLQTDHKRLFDDYQDMRAAYDKLSKDYSDVLASHKQVKTDYNTLQLKSTEQQGELTEAKENLSVADVEFQKLENKMELVYQINERLENENQALLLQIQQLLNQNQELLTQALNSKDHFAEEEKAYLEKLSELRRQKERLEEKIMDHYKNRISPKKKGLGALIARKARGIISRTPKRSKSRNNLTDPNDNSSQGSGSTEHVNDPSKRLDKGLSRRRKSSPNLDSDSPKLASQNRSLAKSYTALHSPVFENELSPTMRGAKSSEDLSDGAIGEPVMLPGLGKPYNMDDIDAAGQKPTTPGLMGRRTPGRSSPGSEMLTLDQFLKEANKSPRNALDVSATEQPKVDSQRRVSHDSESRSSENSNNSNNRLQQPRQPHHGSIINVPDIAATPLSSSVSRDLSASRISRLSAGSGHDNSSFGSSGPFPSDVFASTPKTDMESSESVIMRGRDLDTYPSTGPPGLHDHSGSEHRLSMEGSVNMSYGSNRYAPHKQLSGDEGRSSSQESSPYTGANRMSQFGSHLPNMSSSSPRASGSQSSQSSLSGNTSQSTSHPQSSSHQGLSHQQQNHPTNALSSNSSIGNRSRGIPPVPTEPPPPIPATERLDRLTMSSMGDQPQYAQPMVDRSFGDGDLSSRSGYIVDKLSERDIDREMRGRGSRELERSKSQGSLERPHGLPNQFQPPVPRSQPPGSLNSNHQNSNNNNNNNNNVNQILDNSVVSGHNPRRPPAKTVTSQNNPIHRARPASVMGSSGHVRGVISRPQGEGRPHQQQPGGSQAPNRRPGPRRGPQELNGNNPYNQPPQAVERPKSVPPQLFNKSEDSPDYGGNQPRREVPVPPPRRTRDPRQESRETVEDSRDSGSQAPASGVSLLREPSRASSRTSAPLPLSHAQSSRAPQQQQQVYPGYPSQQQALNTSGNLAPQQSQYPSQSSPRNQGTSASYDTAVQMRPNPMGQSSVRPDSLSLTSNVRNPAMPRSQSSMGQPVMGPSGAQYGRSSTPGPQYGTRRDIPPNSHYQGDSRDGTPMHNHRDLRDVGGAEGQGYSHKNSNVSGPLFSPTSTYSNERGGQDMRQVRGGSEPRDIPYGQESPGRGPQGMGSGYPPNDTGYYPPSNSQAGPHSRSRSQGPVQARNPMSMPQADMSSNGPMSQYGGPTSPSTHGLQQQPPHQNSYSSHPTQSIPPQIRSQGKPHPGSFQNSIPAGSSRQSMPPAPQRPTEEVTSPDRGQAVLPSKPALNAPARAEREPAEGEQPKHTNSIWRPRRS